MTTNDDLLAAIHNIDKKLEVHIARDEGQWEKIADCEEDIKVLVKDNGKLKTKHAALVATIATALSGGVHAALKALL